MLYWLLYLKLFHYFPPFRIFRYLTFRTAFASLTALFTALIVGPIVINRLREFQIGQFIREEGPKAHQKKAGTPTMGGLLIAISIVVPTLLWADLSNLLIWIAVLRHLRLCRHWIHRRLHQSREPQESRPHVKSQAGLADCREHPDRRGADRHADPGRVLHQADGAFHQAVSPRSGDREANEPSCICGRWRFFLLLLLSCW